MITKYKIVIFVIFVSIVSIVISCITLYLIKLKNNNQKTSNIKDNYDYSNIDSEAHTTGLSINKGYDNYKEELFYKEKYISCTSSNYRLFGISGYSHGFLASNVDSVNRLDKIEIPYLQDFENPKCSFNVGKDAEAEFDFK